MSYGPLCWRRCLARFLRAIHTAAPSTERKRVRTDMIYPADRPRHAAECERVRTDMIYPADLAARHAAEGEHLPALTRASMLR